MAVVDSFLPIRSVTADYKADTETVTIGADTVHRQRVRLVGELATDLVNVTSNALHTRITGLVTLAGNSAMDESLNAVSVALANKLQSIIDGALGDTVAVSGEEAHDAAATTRPVRLGAYAKATAPTDVNADGDVVNLWADRAGRLHVLQDSLPALIAGTALVGDVDLQLRATGGSTAYKLVSGASTNATSVKASAGKVIGIQAFNVNAEERWLKLYNKASAPNVGTDVPIKTLAIPGATTGAGFIYSLPHGVAFSTGIAFALTTGPTDADTGAVAASEIVVNLDYA